MVVRQEPQTSAFSFTQGFLLGQISIAVLIFAFIKFFIFGDPPPPEYRANARYQARQQRALSLSHKRAGSFAALRHKSSAVLKPPQSLNTASILAKTYYNVSGHQPESLDWFNVLIAQTIAQLRADAQQDDAILGTLQRALNGTVRPDWLDEIDITEISLGEEFPIFSNCRIIPVDDGTSSNDLTSDGRGKFRIGERTQLQARMDVDLSDVVTLGIETKLVLNYPKPRSAVLPVALAVSVIRFSGTLSLSFIPTSEPDSQAHATPASAWARADRNSAASPLNPYHPPLSLTFTFLPDYRLDLSVRSLLGSRARLTDVPKIAQLIEDRIHAWFDERVVEPRFQQIMLPNFWPRKQTARGPESEEPVADLDAAGRAADESGDEGYASGAARLARPARSESPDVSISAPPEDESFEARMEREGRKLRDASIGAWQRGVQRTTAAPSQIQIEGQATAFRRRPHDRSRSREGMRMPGSMPE